MLKNTKKFALNFKLLKFILLPAILVSTPLFNNLQNAKAGLEFQWDQGSGFKKLKWFQKDDRNSFRNKIYFFLRPSDRKTDLLKINLTNPKPFKAKLSEEKISLCKVRIGGYEDRTKCLEDIQADIEINSEKSSLYSINIYPYSPIPSNKDSYAVVFKVTNPRRTGLYQFHSYGQFKGQTVSSYLGSWTIRID